MNSSFGKDTQRQGSGASHCSSMDNSKLVSPAPPIGSRATNPFALEGQSSYIELHPLKDCFCLAAWIFSGDRSRKEAFLMMETTIICASWASGTDKQYNSVWKKWCG